MLFRRVPCIRTRATIPVAYVLYGIHRGWQQLTRHWRMSAFLPCTEGRQCGPGKEFPRARDLGIRKRAMRSCRFPVRLAALSSSTVAVEGAQLELLSCGSEDSSGTPPILFLHGAAHGAWCWGERLMPEMMKSGITTYAVSFRGHVRDPLPLTRLCVLALRPRKCGTCTIHPACVAHIKCKALQCRTT